MPSRHPYCANNNCKYIDTFHTIKGFSGMIKNCMTEKDCLCVFRMLRPEDQSIKRKPDYESYG